MLTPVLGDPADVERYDAFISDLIGLIVEKYDGSLKAEHGTGRNMAPFVEREWGAKATEMMWRIKALCDPDGVLNPGVVLNRDPGIHLRTCRRRRRSRRRRRRAWSAGSASRSARRAG